MKTFIIALILFSQFGFFSVKAQNISGNVNYRNTEEPLAGATIVIKGTPRGTVTDVKGNFLLQVDSFPATLSISFIGFETKEITLEEAQKVDVSLEEEPIEWHPFRITANIRWEKPKIYGSINGVSSQKPDAGSDKKKMELLSLGKDWYEPADQQEWMRFIYQELKYPELAMEAGIVCIVYTRFTVDSQGNVFNIRLLRGCDPLIDSEVIRVLKSMPPWSPHDLKQFAYRYNKGLDITFVLPFMFRINAVD
ncbi:MAG: carboxypeptidase-like regulatory domain-containing protein [Bacteroidales bacterium]|nr:carboxypeptidase-like regulatory domain-containing protein [Bacteroidales bacterium]